MASRMTFRALAVAAALALATPAFAADNYPVKDGLSVLRTFGAKLVGGILYPYHLMMGLSGGTPTAVTMTVPGALDVTVVGGSTATAQATGNSSLGTIVTGIGAPGDSAWASGNGTEIALLKTIATGILDTSTEAPTKTADGSDVALGAKASGACSNDNGTCDLIALLKRTNQRLSSAIIALGSPFQAAGALGASEVHGMEVGGNALPIIAAQTVTASSAYTSGNAIGGLITLSNAVRVSGTLGASGTTAMLQDITVNFKSTQTAEVDVVFFKANPTGSTCTDKTAFSLATADFDKVIDVIPLTVYAPSLGTPSLVSARNISRTFGISSGTTAYACAITRGTPTFTATSDVSLTFGLVRN